MCSLTSFFVGGKCLLNQTTYSVSYFVYMQYVSIHLSIYLFYVSIHLYDVMGLFVEWLVVRLATQVAVQRWKKIKDTYYWQEGAEVMVECETLALVHHLIIMFLGLPPPTLFPPSLLPSPLFPSPISSLSSVLDRPVGHIARLPFGGLRPHSSMYPLQYPKVTRKSVV